MFNFKKHKKKPEHKSGLLQNPKILEVNLVRNETQVSFNWTQNLSLLIMVLIVAIIFVLELYFGLDWWQKREEANIKVVSDKITEINAQVVSLKNKNEDALDYKAKSAAFSALLDNHIYWNNFFSWLEKNTLNSVQYNNFQGDLSGSYQLDALAPTYADVSWQVKAFLNDPAVNSAEVKSATIAKDADKTKANQVSFSLLLQVNPTIFTK